MIVFIMVLIFVLWGYFKSIQRILREKKEQYRIELAFQKKMLRRSIEVQETERERIARALHDEVGNRLNILSVWLNNPSNWNNPSSQETIVSQLPPLIEITRTISHQLFPANLERFGLIVALEELFANVETSLVVEFTDRGYQSRSLEFEVNMYRIVQEFLTNVLKHSEAHGFAFVLKETAGFLYGKLSDDGKGVAFDSVKKGMGTRNIELRLNSLGALHKIKSIPGRGCVLIFRISK